MNKNNQDPFIPGALLELENAGNILLLVLSVEGEDVSFLRIPELTTLNANKRWFTLGGIWTVRVVVP